METTTLLSLSDYYSLKQMLLSTDEDKTLAYSNIRNLGLEPIYIVLLAKELMLEDRAKMVEEFSDVFSLSILSDLKTTINNWHGNRTVTDLSWNKIHSVIKAHYSDEWVAKKIFEQEFKKEWFVQVVKSTTWNFIEDVELKVKW